jgi:rhodanese-related sulfurtransferase
MKQITATEVQNLLQSGKKLNLVDVRETEEVAGGKIPGAENLPLGLIQFKLNELDKNKEYIIVCRSGARSGMATQLLKSYGYNATNMVGGMLSWTGEIE